MLPRQNAAWLKNYQVLAALLWTEQSHEQKKTKRHYNHCSVFTALPVIWLPSPALLPYLGRIP